MSYIPLGTSLAEALDLAKKVINDPHLPEFACEAQRLKNASAGLPPGTDCPRVMTATQQQIAAGIGLHNFLTPMRVATFHEQYPWALPLGLAVVAGVIYTIGHEAGRRGR